MFRRIRRPWRRLAGAAALLLAQPGWPGSSEAESVQALADALQVCAIPNPQQPSSAFHIERSAPNADGDYYVAYRCAEACDDWRQCQAEAHTAGGRPIAAGGSPRQAVAFVVDGMGGHLAFSTRQHGDRTVLLHTGGGGTGYMQGLALQIEAASRTQVVMVRWENGFSGWGWFTRTSAPATRVPRLTRRVASAMAWTHEHLAGPGSFGTVGCSMGAQATLGAVYYHGVDPVVDYQLMVGGPGLWDINAGCGRRTYATGHCDLDPGQACREDAECAGLSPRSRCTKPGPIPLAWLYEQVVNHVHATEACNVAAAASAPGSYQPFDESGFAFAAGDWDFDHPIDFQMDLWGPDGDRHWAMGDAMRVFNRITSAAGHPKRWHTTADSNHCAAIGNGRALELLIAGMGLGSAPPPTAVAEPPEVTLAADGESTSIALTALFAAPETTTFQATSEDPALLAASIVDRALVLEANVDGVEGVATVLVTAADRAGQAATLRLRVTVEFASRGFMRRWRTALAPGG